MTLSKKQGVLVALAVLALFVISVFAFVWIFNGFFSVTGVDIKAKDEGLTLSGDQRLVTLKITNMGTFFGLMGGTDFRPHDVRFYENGARVYTYTTWPWSPSPVTVGQMDVPIDYYFGTKAHPDTLQYDYMGVTRTVVIVP